jgi:uncharacterized protein Yka (UPF0111/DUF47 family)
LGPGTYHIPEAKRLIAMLGAALDRMIAPLTLAEDGSGKRQCFTERKAHLFDALPPIDGDVIQAGTISALTSASPGSRDGVHLLIMDLHKEINRLQTLIAEEEVDGAQAYGLLAADRPRIGAFMKGVRSTEALKFDHPGLATTAARNGGTLLIQNDIGETDAHVLVIQITDFNATLTYTDVHPQRLTFFRDVLAAIGMEWHETRSRQTAGLADDDLFYVATGTFTMSDELAMLRFLEQLGSRIVFLIDWNRARKRLGLLVPNALAVELLRWAADNNFGHRAFLQLGGERLVYDALEQAVRAPLRYGEKLHEMIGLDVAGDYLRFVLEIASAGLQSGQSHVLVRDRIRAELFNHFRSAEQRLFTESARHAAIIARLARGLSDALRQGTFSGDDTSRRNAARAKELESQADEIVRTVRTTVRRISGTEIFCRIIEIADDAADELEDAAFLAAIDIGDSSNVVCPEPLIGLTQLALDGARAFQRAVDAAPLVHRGGAREPVQSFLEAVDLLVTVEHKTDAMERDVAVALVGTAIDGRQLHLFSQIAHHLERATDSLLRASLILRDHVLGQVLFE